MEAWVVVALEERKSMWVPGWLLERQSVAGGFPESVCVWGLRGGSLLEYQVLLPNVWYPRARRSAGMGGGDRSTGIGGQGSQRVGNGVGEKEEGDLRPTG